MARLPLIGLLWIIVVSSGCSGPPQGAHGDGQAQLLSLGDSISAATQATLLQYVSQAMQTGGASYAVDFCNSQAMELTDSLARAHHVRIQRLSDRNRNPDNALRTEADKAAWARLQGAEAGQDAGLLLDGEDGDKLYYKPIFLGMPTCLQCHGKPQADIADGTLRAIQEKYPDDKALGYALGDLRGIWKITWTENH